MVIGEYKSSNFQELIRREQDIIKLFEKYCRQHNRILETQFGILSSYPLLFLLKFKISTK